MDKLFVRLLNNSISAGWLILMILILRPLMKRIPKSAQCLLWGIVGLRLIFPFRLESVLSLVPSAHTLPENILYDPSPAISSGIRVIDDAINPVFTGSFSTQGVTSINPLQIWSSIAGWVWLLGAAAMVTYLIVSYLKLYKAVCASVCIGEQVWICDYIDTPFILGVIHPRIYIPSTLQGADLIHVLAHERSHLRRKDHWWKPVGYLILCVYWFSPLVWVGYILLCRDIEMACDERVIRSLDTQERKAYSQALLRCSIRPKMVAACPLAFGEVGVKQRIKSVLYYKKPGFWLILLAVCICIAVAACFLTDPVAPDTPESVTFNATVLEVEQDRLLVAPAYDPGGTIWVSCKKGLPEVNAGYFVQIEHSGYIHMTLPAQIPDAYSVTVLGSQSGAESYSHMIVDGYLCVGIDLPEGWECQELNADGEFGFYFHPEGVTGGVKLYHANNGFAACGTDVEIIEAELANGHTMFRWYYGGSKVWPHATFDAPGCYVAVTDQVETWWEDYEDQVMEIISNAALGMEVISEEQAIAIALDAYGLKGQHPIASFDPMTGLWRVSFFRRLEDSAPSQIFLVSAKGELMDSDNWGLALTASQVTPNGMMLTCTQAGTHHVGMLITGRHFWLERKTEHGWEVLEPITDEVIFTTEGLLISQNGSVSWDVRWDHIYGTLEPGVYRMGKDVTMDPSNKLMGQLETKTFYAEFIVE